MYLPDGSSVHEQYTVRSPLFEGKTGGTEEKLSSCVVKDKSGFYVYILMVGTLGSGLSYMMTMMGFLRSSKEDRRNYIVSDYQQDVLEKKERRNYFLGD